MIGESLDFFSDLREKKRAESVRMRACNVFCSDVSLLSPSIV